MNLTPAYDDTQPAPVLSCCHAATGEPSCASCLIAAAAELLAQSDAIDQAAEVAAAVWRGRAAAEIECARSEGYAAAIADVKGVEHGLVGLARDLAEAERFRWVVRGEVRTRATFGDPHPGDYLGGPVSLARAS